MIIGERPARYLRPLLLVAIAGLTGSVAWPQSSEEQRAALEEGERLRAAARTFAANARRIVAYDLSGRELAAIGEPDIYTYVKYSPDLSRVATIRVDLERELSDIVILDAGTGEETQLTESRSREFVQSPVWSPDGSEIVYVALRGSRFGIYRQDPSGAGEAELVYEHGGGPIVLGDWSLNGETLAFSASDLAGGRIYTIGLDGEREPVLILESESAANTPRFSVDGRYLSYFSDESGRNEYYMIRATPATGGERQRWQVTTDGAFGIGQWDVDGSKYYFLGPERRVMAIDVDTSGDELVLGTPEHIYTVPDAIPAGGGGGLVTMSESGDRLIMALPPVPELLQIVALDRNGDELQRIGEPGIYLQPAFSPDGSKVVALKLDVETGAVDVWVFDTDSRAATQVTDTVDTGETSPIWLADGRHVAYSYFEQDRSQIWRRSADGEGEQELLFEYTPGAFITLMDASKDGRYLAFESFGFVVSVPLEGDDPAMRQGIDLLREEFEVSVPRFSPDGRYVAYTYNESGRPEVFVTQFDGESGMAADAARVQVSADGVSGGISWRSDGRELYYLSENVDTEDDLYDARVMAVEVELSPEIRVGTARALFELTLPAQGNPTQWQIASPNGERFLFALPAP